MSSPHSSSQQRCPCSPHPVSVLTLKDFWKIFSAKTHPTQTWGKLHRVPWAQPKWRARVPHLRSLPACRLWPWLKWQIPFSVLFFRRITEHNVRWCSAAVRIPLLWLSLPGYQGAEGETGAAPCQEQVIPASSNQPTAGHSWERHPRECLRESVFQKGQKMPLEQWWMRGESVRNSCGKTQVIPEEGRKLCHLHWGRIPGSPQRRPARTGGYDCVFT